MRPSKQNVLKSSMCRLRTALSGRHCTLQKGHDVCITLAKVQTRHMFLKIQFTHRSVSQPSIMPLIEERVSQKLSLKWVCMITVRIRDRHQHCETGSSSQVERIEDGWTDADFLFRRQLSVLQQQQKGNQKHLIGKATVHCVCPVNRRYNSQYLELRFQLTVVK